MEAIVTASSILLGREVAVQTISNTSSSIISRVTKITENLNDEYIKIFEELDINFKLNMITDFLNTIKDIEKVSSTHICINYINTSLKEIDETISEINTMISNRNSSWFGSSLTTQSSNKQFNKLKLKVKIMDARFNMLIKLQERHF